MNIKNKDKAREYKKKFRLAHPGYEAEHALRDRISHPERNLLKNAKQRARKKNIPFNLTIKDIVIPQRCPILGIPLQQKLGLGKRGPTPNSPSLDRVIPEKGYVKGNVAVISFLANTMKNDTSLDVFRSIVKYMESYGV